MTKSWSSVGYIYFDKCPNLENCQLTWLLLDLYWNMAVLWEGHISHLSVKHSFPQPNQVVDDVNRGHLASESPGDARVFKRRCETQCGSHLLHVQWNIDITCPVYNVHSAETYFFWSPEAQTIKFYVFYSVYNGLLCNVLLAVTDSFGGSK